MELQIEKNKEYQLHFENKFYLKITKGKYTAMDQMQMRKGSLAGVAVPVKEEVV